jgi:small-conductance mechanosensitive channel
VNTWYHTLSFQIMTTTKKSQKRISSHLLVFKQEESFAKFLNKKCFEGFLADYLVFFLATVVSVSAFGLIWCGTYQLKNAATLNAVNFFKFLTLFTLCFKISQVATVVFVHTFQLIWGSLHRYTQYVVYLMKTINSVIFCFISLISLMVCIWMDNLGAKGTASWVSASLISRAKMLNENSFEIIISKVFLMAFFASLLWLLEKVFIFFAINMYQQEDEEKRLNSSTLKVIEALRGKYFAKHDNISKDNCSVAEEDSEIAKDIAEAIYSNVKATSPRGADSIGLKPEDFAHILTRQEISNLYRGIDFDGSGDISKSELAQAIQLLYQEQKDLAKSNEDACSIIGRVEEILIGAICYCVFLFGSLIFDFKVPVTIITLIGGTIIAWLAMDETLKEILNTFTFLFFIHPFDIGDKIIFQGVNYSIRGIHFLHTEMVTAGNTVAYIKNSAFCGEKILNFKRSDFQSETVTLNIHPNSIEEERLKELGKKMNAFLEAHNEDYMPSCSLGKLNYESSSSVKMGVSYMHKANFCNGALYQKRCVAFNKELHQAFIQCGLKYGS